MPGAGREQRWVPSADLSAYERRFRRAGLPLLIEDYSATEDIFTRAVPVLAFLFLIQVVNGVNLDWPLWANLIVLVAGVVVLLAPVGMLNRRRGQRFLSLPARVGPLELVAFVLVPAALPLIIGGRMGEAIDIAVGNVFILAVTYVVVGLGLVSIVRWAVAHVGGQIVNSIGLLSRAVPLLLVFTLVLFVNREMWEVFAEAAGGEVAIVAVAFVGAGLAFLAVRLPREVRGLEAEVAAGPPLRRRQRFNVGLVLFVSQALQTLIVGAAVGFAFVCFGGLVIDAGLASSWAGQATDELAEFDFLGQDVLITAELIRVSAVLGAFSSLYYAIAVLNDRTYRAELIEEQTEGMRATLAERAEYLRRRAAVAA